MNNFKIDHRPRTPLLSRWPGLVAVGLSLVAAPAKAAWTVGYFTRILACLGILNAIAILGGQLMDAHITLAGCEFSGYCSDEHVDRLRSLISSLEADIQAAWASYRARGCDR